VDSYSGTVKANLKHIMWYPDETHDWEILTEKKYSNITDMEIATDYGQIQISRAILGDEFDSIEAKRTHIQMQIALIEIGRALNFRSWIAKPDQSIRYGDKTIADIESVMPSLQNAAIFFDEEIKRAANFIRKAP